MQKYLKALLVIQGSFYAMTALWAIVYLPGFLSFTENTADPFKTQSNAVLFLALAVVYFFTARHTELIKKGSLLALGTAFLIAMVDIIYIKLGQTSGMFWYDFLEESAVVILFSVMLLRHSAPKV